MTATSAAAGRRRRRVRRAALNGAGLLVFVISVFPVFWMVSTAFKPNEEIFATTPRPLPLHPTLHHFDYVLNGGIASTPFFDYFKHSLIVAVGAVSVAAVFALLAATAVARFRWRFRTTFLVLLLIVQMVPIEAMVLPMFINAKRLDLLNSLSGLIIVYIGIALPFGIWMLRGFVAAVPKELEEAAAIDGASRWRTFWSILFPLVAPGLVATSIFSFITAWNEFTIAYTFLSDANELYTLPVALQYFFGRAGTEWGPLMAASTLLTLPVVLFFLLVQRRMVSGLVSGAVKG